MLTQTVPRGPSPPWLQAARWVLDPVRYMSDCRQTHPDLFATRISGRHGDPVIFVQEGATSETRAAINVMVTSSSRRENPRRFTVNAWSLG